MPRLTPAILAPLLLAGCVGAPPIAQPAPQPRFDVFAFFAGPTLGTGRLKKILSGTESTLVHGTGRVEGDTLVLDQTVEEGDKPAKHRQWRIRRTGPGRYSGTLTDASGPVTGEVEGNRLHLSFTMKGGLPTQQWLTLAPDGRSAHNIMTVTKLGLTVAVLDEDIRKTD
ncbi:DUF3833 family protein [Stakelama marina]|uniref:DUF3833 family protein n=1 Tax=Stakelama marina TaxID=2826939 RepID=A0A8T4IGA6_9SPHN|nr:DUF3833 family protein [Stakelama marina]MBR0553072.1 DUF3833 family protein [Stakelama marina]